MPTRHGDETAAGLRAAVNRLAYHLRTPATDRGLTPSRLSVLLLLNRYGEQRPGEIATAVGIRPASMTRLTEALEDEGWVARTPDPDDRRACRLTLTDHGVQVLQDWRREGITWLSDEISTLDEAEYAALAGALPVLEKLADRRLERAAALVRGGEAE